MNLHGSIVVFRGLPGSHEKQKKLYSVKDLCIHVGLNAHAQKKGCIRNSQ